MDLKTQYECDKYIVDSWEEHQSFADIDTSQQIKDFREYTAR